MKVYGCKNNVEYGGGLILVAANTKEEAYLTVAMDNNLDYLFDWVDDGGFYCEPDGNINHCTSYTYPLEEWYTHQSIVSDFPVRQDSLESRERIQIHLFGILARIGSHKGGNEDIAA